MLLDFPKKIAFVDIETTAYNFNCDRIIKIAILKVENNRLVSTYQTLINPELYVPNEIEQLTGINSRELSSSPVFNQVKDEVLDHLEGCNFAAHNARLIMGSSKRNSKWKILPLKLNNFVLLNYPENFFRNIVAII